jgi:CubicO group peptidase (beta-lactamase class C family)
MKKSPKFLFILFLSLFLFISCEKPGTLEPVTPETVGISADRLIHIDNLLENIVEQKNAKGVVAAIARKGKLVYMNAVGDMDEGKPMEENTIFRICSQTKLVTSIAVMMLFEEGHFTLNESISNYIPEFSDTKVLIEDSTSAKGYHLVPPKREITLRDLLAHTSGISYAFWGRPYIAEWYINAGVSDGLSETDGTIADNIKRLAACPLLFHPGEGYEYGLNIDVLGYFVEIVSGVPLDQFFRERIFEPLGMKDTYFFLPEEKVSRLAAVYDYDSTGNLVRLDSRKTGPGFGNNTVNTNVYDATYPYKGARSCFFGGAGLSSTAMDYMRLCQMILNKGTFNNVRLLSPHAVDYMMRNHAGTYGGDSLGEGFHVAFGGSVVDDPDPSGTFLPAGTFGWGGYYATSFDIDFKNKMIYILFTQRSPYQNFHGQEFAKFRVLAHAAIIEE